MFGQSCGISMKYKLKNMQCLVVCLTTLFGFSANAADVCNELKERANNIMDDVVIQRAQYYSEGEKFAPPAGARMRTRNQLNPAFCRVQGIIEAEIRFEVWLPDPDVWNKRFLGVGNGGEAGWINYNELQRGLSRHFASASTDTGHVSSDTHWALGYPERVENFGHRAHHLLAQKAKQIVHLYYQSAADFSYFIGCSGGGLQGLNEVQRYPTDYDGVITGAAGYSMVPLSARFILSGLLEEQHPAGNLTSEAWQRVANDAVESCDSKDGVKDGIVNDPRQCDFDIDAISYLSNDQKTRVKTLYGPIKDNTGQQLYPGFYPGIQFIPQARQMNVAGRSFGEWLYQDANWKPQDFNLDSDIKNAEASLTGLRAANPDLFPFQRVGGKLISYMGWDDPTVPAQANIDYYENVKKVMGPITDTFFKLYMVPGMGHCRGGAGADQFGQAFAGNAPIVDAEHDVLEAIVEWVENGNAPSKLIASKVVNNEVTMTRPICPYPMLPRYNGVDSPNFASSFECK